MIKSFRLFTILFVLIWCTLGIAQDLTRISGSNTQSPFNPESATVLRWDDGVNATSIGLTSGGDMEVAARFDASIMTPLAGQELTQIEVYIALFTGTLVLNVYGQDTPTNPGPLLYSEDVSGSVVYDAWNLFTLATPVPISGDDIWVGYIASHLAGEFPAGADAGPHVVDGDWVNLGGWQSLFDATGGAIDANWNIAAYVEGGGTTTFFDDFDAYTAGVQLVGQSGGEWDTWSGTAGGSEDPFVSDAYSWSGSNTVVIAENNDLVRYHGELTTGKWYISFLMYIPTGGSGYFNSMSGFTPNPFQWAHEVYFDAGGAGRLLADVQVDFTWLEDTWQQAMVVVDLDTDNAEFWFGATAPLTMVHSWEWTRGGTVNLQLDVTDFFGAATTEEMYVDDYYFSDTPPAFIPVELTSFTANVNHSGQVELNWSTATETNNQLFEIERRTEEGQFSTIGYVEGHGTTTEPQNYSYTDVTVNTGIYFYRLKQLDFLGYYEYFDEIEVDVNGPLSFDLEQNYPNPFNPSTNIKFSVPESGNVRLAVYNLIGEEVAVLVDGFSEAGFFEVTFNASSLPSGAYFYKLQSGNNVVAKKMLLMK